MERGLRHGGPVLLIGTPLSTPLPPVADCQDLRCFWGLWHEGSVSLVITLLLQGGSGMWIPNQGLGEEGPAEGRKKK